MYTLQLRSCRRKGRDRDCVVPCSGVLGMDSLTVITRFFSSLATQCPCQAGRQPLAAPEAAPGERAHSGDLLVRMECSSVHSPPLGSVNRWEADSFQFWLSNPALLCLPSSPLYCILRDLLGVFQRWNLERWGKPLWRKANSLYLACFLLPKLQGSTIHGIFHST